MSLPLPGMLLALVVQSPLDSVPLQPEECRRPAAHHQLTAETEAAERVLCVTPGLASTLLFDTMLPAGAVQAQEDTCLDRLDSGRDTVTLLPSKGMRPARRCKVVIHFGDDAAPRTFTLTLVGTSWGATRQVEVHRKPRTLESYQLEVEQLQAELFQLREEKARSPLGAEPPRGLRGLIADGIVGSQGVAAMRIARGIRASSEARLLVTDAFSYIAPPPRRSTQGPTLLRAAVELFVGNSGESPFRVQRALLVGPKGTEPKPTEVLQREELVPDKETQVVVETTLTEAEAAATWRLELWGEDGWLLKVDSITFPRPAVP